MREFLVKVKKENNYTIEQLAKIVGVSMSAMSKVLNGQREPSKTFIRKSKAAYPQIDLNKNF